jgi:cytochrome b involved in lipid metabolism
MSKYTIKIQTQAGFIPLFIIILVMLSVGGLTMYGVEKYNNEAKLKSETSGQLSGEDKVVNETDVSGTTNTSTVNTSTKSTTKATIKAKVGESDDDGDENESEDGDEGISGSVSVNANTSASSGTTSLKSYTLADVKLHNNASNCWTTVNGSVYNVTSWINQHPGGSAAIMGTCGIDASAAFNGQHGGQARPASELASFKIGVLVK